MPLEASVIILDNSNYGRNGDFAPTRAEAQADAVNLLATAKTDSNPESSVGLMSAGGSQPQVHVTLTQDVGLVLTALHNVSLSGTCDFLTAIRVATLILKHRQNKSQRQRVIVFVGSPITADQADLVTLAKQLKKNNVACDVVSYGEADANQAKLQAFNAAVNNNNNSTLLNIEAGAILSDILVSSPLFFDAEGSGGGGGGADDDTAAAIAASQASAPAGAGAGAGAVDPNTDPELAMALAMSLQEEEERQRRSAPADAPAHSDVSAMDADADPELLAALEMSMQSGQSSAPASAPAPAQTPSAPAPAEEEEDEDLRLAREMSMQTDPPASGGGAGAPADADLAAILGSLPGVDTSDPRIRDLLAGLGNADKDKKPDESDPKKKPE